MKKDYFILFILIFYFFFQFSTLDYGFKINDLNYFKNISIKEKIIEDFTEKEVIKKKENIKNNTEPWIYRYKLYSINADEVLPIMALSKIKINENKFDPQIYKYGGAFIYPLGLYYYFLNKTNSLEDINSYSIVNNEKLIDDIYFFGRLFILLCFIFSALILYKILKFVTKENYALVFTLIYLFTPSSIMYSQIIKPNWYALLWFNLSILYICKYLNLKHIRQKNYEKISFKKKIYLLLISIFLGLAIGSSILFIPAFILILFIIFDELDVSFKVWSIDRWHRNNTFKFLIIPSLIIFFITNPYILINFSDFINESSGEYLWVIEGIKFENIFLFFHNSFFLGFGLILSLTLFYYLLKVFLKSSKISIKGALIENRISIAIICLILFGAVISGFDDWHIQFRYIPYILPISLIFLAQKIKNYKFVLFIFFATLLQAIPLKLAFYDENILKYSTRLNSAKWINENIIEKEKSICKKDFTPFDFPPINFNKVKVEKDCDFGIHILRQPKKIEEYNYGKIIKKFEPRYQFPNIPLVFSHINPLIIVVENLNE